MRVEVDQHTRDFLISLRFNPGPILVAAQVAVGPSQGVTLISFEASYGIQVSSDSSKTKICDPRVQAIVTHDDIRLDNMSVPS